MTEGGFASDRSVPEPPRPTHDFLADTLANAGAAGFVHAGTPADPDLRYLTGGADAERRLAFAFADGDAVLVQGTGHTRDGHRSSATSAPSRFPGEVLSAAPVDALSRVAVDWLAERRDGGTILAPRHVPHDTALYVERAGFDLRSTAAVADARATKTDDELVCLRRTADASSRGMARAASLLAAATSDGEGTDSGDLAWEGEPLSAERLHREVNATLASHGVEPAGNTRVSVGADERQTAADARALPTGEPVEIAVAPRGPAGYHAPLARTFVVDGGGGWDRRAHVACEAARGAALAEIAPGTPAVSVAEELLAELRAYGLDPRGGADGDGDDFDVVGGGVGLARREAPAFGGDAELDAGTVLSLSPVAADPAEGRVGLTDTVIVGEDGPEVATRFPTAIVPSRE